MQRNKTCLLALSVFASSIGLYQAPACAQAADALSAAYPEEISEVKVQGTIGGAEMAAGGLAVALSQRQINQYQGGARPSIHHYVEDEIKAHARAEIAAADPKYAEAVRRQNAVTSYNFAVKDFREATDIAGYQRLLKSAEEMRADFDAGEKRVAALSADIHADLKAGKPLAGELGDRAKTYRAKLLRHKLLAAFGLAAVADGGARLGLALSGNSPGYLPAIVGVSAPGKPKAKSAPSAAENTGSGKQSSMSIE